MRLFRFVKEQRPFDCPLAHPAEITAFTKTRAEQQPKRVLHLKLGHIEAEQLSGTEYLSGGHQDGFRFPDPGRSQQQKAPARAGGLGETEFTASNRGDDSRQDAGLAADFAWQQRVQFLEFVELRRVSSRVHPLSTTTDSPRILCSTYIFASIAGGSCGGMIQRKNRWPSKKTTNINAMKFRKKLTPQVRSRLRSVLMVAAMLLLNTLSAFAQAGGGFNSTDLKTGISNSLAVIMMFGFVLGISAVIYGGFAIRRGDVD